MALRTFTYVATDSQGTRKTGVLDAPSERFVRDRLASEGLKVESIHEGAVKVGRSAFVRHVGAPLVGRVNYEALQRFFAQLWSMHKSGVPLHQSLDTLARNQRHPKLRHVIADMRDHVLEGKMISQAMEKYPEVFSPLQISLTRAGERGGVLERSLQETSDYLMREVKLRNQMKAGTFYAKVVLFFVLAVPFATNYIVKGIAAQTGGPAFGITSFLDSPVFITAAIAFLVFWLVVFRILIQVPAVKWWWDGMLLALPYVGSTVRMFTMAKFGRAFSALYGGGIPISEAVVLAADASGNEYIRRRISPAAVWIQEGRGITESLARTGAFTNIALDMAHTGEHTGNMEAMLDNVAEQYEDETSVRIDKLSRVLPVALLVIAAVVVGYIVVSFYTGYFGAVMGEG